ncbi:GSCFA domain-containing protein [Rhodobacter ferrooxidans]|uniref:GSCFA domain protein n=1 Tax=Rhodobacter ferrooxidans TaxID=371731 RepID=C8RXT7_9RHOB|nr:GSCFA domain-containing protein [Rhodobacter sp. SW2]EEW26335.1 GSCFA domain protein [Rhodobacter sp. SW2]
MASPYENLPARSYWRSGVAERAPLDPGALYTPRFAVTPRMQVATAGSCFAQHIGRSLRQAGLRVIDAEPLPATVPEALAHDHGYGLYSARYGNIYTAAQLLQLWREAEGTHIPQDRVWQRDGRFFDAQRPGVDPRGHASAEAVLRHRAHHLTRVQAAFRAADLLVFTFGLTEAWVHTASGTVFPTAPGTIAGTHDPALYSFRNFNALEVLRDFESFLKALRKVNRRVKLVITVSPVPLTATASGQHVEVATCYSKSVLRAVCGMLVQRHPEIDYFPSYELITSQNSRGAYFEANQRSVSELGVAAAMELFLNGHGLHPTAAQAADPGEDPRCEDALLEAFAR